MDSVKKCFKNVGSVISLIISAIGSYIGVLSSIVGTILGIFASLLVIGAIVGMCLYAKVSPIYSSAKKTVFDKLVNLSEEDFVKMEDTKVYDKDNKLIGKVNAGRYKYVEIKKISSYVYEGYIAVEDKRFKTHNGVDILATLRAGVVLLKNGGEIKQGGSTITQQVIKNNLLTQERSYARKIAEVFLAPKVEEKDRKSVV